MEFPQVKSILCRPASSQDATLNGGGNQDSIAGNHRPNSLAAHVTVVSQVATGTFSANSVGDEKEAGVRPMPVKQVQNHFMWDPREVQKIIATKRGTVMRSFARTEAPIGNDVQPTLHQAKDATTTCIYTKIDVDRTEQYRKRTIRKQAVAAHEEYYARDDATKGTYYLDLKSAASSNYVDYDKSDGKVYSSRAGAPDRHTEVRDFSNRRAALANKRGDVSVQADVSNQKEDVTLKLMNKTYFHQD
ncbi:hypothetical protein [Glaciimonas immobilis]|uniref:Uncharacterized protein n=1 Tax=Glaciimonas immobilis TaxID=728004 RepID=A0A840RVM4_9BURK|nr:hypothetical protein [Glaciimonas immobilis]KAF3997733.1 hypothetical protein HAV38_13845 [Glaciimonas immobilis]MBB5200540.1 hypothetical protein [Glaciimonas immobilis]